MVMFGGEGTVSILLQPSVVDIGLVILTKRVSTLSASTIFKTNNDKTTQYLQKIFLKQTITKLPNICKSYIAPI